MSNTQLPSEVLIDGVRYVPVSDAHVTVRAIEDAVISQYWGDGWRTEYPDALGGTCVVVGEDGDDGRGESASAFIARLLAAAESAQAA